MDIQSLVLLDVLNLLSNNLRSVANETHIEASCNGEPGNPNSLDIQEGIIQQTVDHFKTNT